MVHFTVYYGHNEAMTFNAECSLGALLGNMRDRLMPPGASYPCFELLPLSFVLEQFRPMKPSGSAVGAQQPDVGGDSPMTTGRGQPFTGVFPFVGFPTRPLETRVDTFLGCSTVGSPTLSTLGVGGSFAGLLNSAALSPLQDSYVLLGCRSDPPPWQHSERAGPPNSKRGLALNVADGPQDVRRVPVEVFKRLGNTDISVIEQRQAAVERAQLIASLPLSGGACGARAATPPPAGAQPGQDTPLILAQNAGMYPGEPTHAPWRRSFAQYLSATLETTSCGSVAEGGPSPAGDGPAAENEADNAEGFEAERCGTLLPSPAAGMFVTPVPQIARYDVLWCGTRGEHIRLQEALDERLLVDVDPKRRRPRKS